MLSRRLALLFVVACLIPATAVAVESVLESTSSVDAPIPDEEQTTSTQESEAKDIIPRDSGKTNPAELVTPNSPYLEKNPYEQAQEELIKALELWNAGHAEAASDKALEAYDDFLELRRVPGVKRSRIRAQAHQSAAVYVEAGIAYIKGYVRRLGSTPEAIEEGRSRMEDLREVARNYPELNKMLNSAINKLADPAVDAAK